MARPRAGGSLAADCDAHRHGAVPELDDLELLCESGSSAFLGDLREQLSSKPRTLARATRSAAPSRSMAPAPAPADQEQPAADFDIPAPESRDPGQIATEFDIPRAAVEWLVKK